MTIFSDKAVAALMAPVVRSTLGVCFRFDDGPQYYIRAGFSRKDPSGIWWQGASYIANISGLQLGIGRRTQPATITASGLPGSSWVALAASDSGKVHGRRLEFYLHMFEEDWSYVEPPTSLGVYEMDKLTVEYDGAAQVATVSVSCEPIGVSKFRAPNAYLSREDQRRRYPNDSALDIMPRYVNNQTLEPW